jgi:glycosyltransferase involved in cell wall biosynthesis
LKVLVVHNSYLQPGGEDVVFEQEKRLLRDNGNKVVEFHCRNAQVDGNVRHKLAIAHNALWASETARAMGELVARERPDVAHFHNVFYTISPSCYYACRKQGVPVVLTVHNYRMMCPSMDLFRDGRICEACVGKPLPWPGIMHGCYHASKLQTSVVAAMIAVHHWWKTWRNQVDTYVVPSACIRGKLIQGGFPADKIVVKPNFVDPDPGYRYERGTEYAVFAGRLSREKGATMLVDVWRRISELPLLIAGDGPEAPGVRNFVESAGIKNIQILGYKPRDELMRIVKGASFLVFPSQWHETFGLAVVEAFACGVPVIATRLGAIPELIDDGRTGLMFSPGNPVDLVEKIKWAIRNPQEMDAMRIAARAEYERHYTAAANYPLLHRIYEQAIRDFAPASEGARSSAVVTSDDGRSV